MIDPKQLTGLPLSIVRHAASMLNMQFGTVTRDGEKSWGQLALHIDCPWRLIKDSKILVGRDDQWNPCDKITDWNAWWDNPHPNIEEKFWEAFIGGIDPVTKSFECPTPKYSVTTVDVSTSGDLYLVLNHEYQFQTFGCGTDDEFWRLLEPGKSSDHYVIGTSE